MNNIALATAKIFNETDLSKLDALYNSSMGSKWYQDYNLFKVTKKHINPGGKYHTVLDKTRLWLPNPDDYELKTNYFLKYEQGSWTKIHVDSYKKDEGKKDSEGITFVTLIHASPDLKGGDALVMAPHDAPEYMTFTQRKGPEDNAKKGALVVPRIVHLTQGQTMVYGDRLPHGVTYIERGERIVLVTWYTKKTTEKQ
jgi:predicted 2-oxoglutarate/Fe(II)-dependent dioxygenase YbiX